MTAKKQYVGTWVGSMMTHPWVYEGALDAAEKVLTLEAEGPDMGATGKMAKYRDVIELHSDDHRALTSHMLGDDGKWRQFMVAHYRRKRWGDQRAASGGFTRPAPELRAAAARGIDVRRRW